MQLMSNPADSAFVMDHFCSNLDEGIPFTLERCNSVDSFSRNHYLTDHHWTIAGVYKGYETIANQLGLEVVKPEGEIPYPQYPFHGSYARLGLDLSIGEYLTDYSFDLPDLQVWRKGEKIERTHKQNYLDGTVDKQQAELNAYGYYYGSDYDRIVYTNSSGNAIGNLLIIGDSFTQPIEPLFASAYLRTHVLDPRHFAGSIKDYIRDNDINDIIIIASADTLESKATLASLT